MDEAAAAAHGAAMHAPTSKRPDSSMYHAVAGEMDALERLKRSL